MSMGLNDSDATNSNILTKEQIDIIGEVSNISMGAAATALSNIIGKKVVITSPSVLCGSRAVLDSIEQVPSIGVTISYTEGIIGQDFLILKKSDALEIVKVLMGGELPDGEEFGELELSAIGEVMNQMMGSSATALSGFIGKNVNISPPSAFVLTDENKQDRLKFIYDRIENIVLVKFLFRAENLFESEIYMVMSHEFSLELVHAMLVNMGMESPEPKKEQSQAEEPVPPQVSLPRQESSYARQEEPPAEKSAAASLAAAPTMVRPAVFPNFGPSEPISSSEEANFSLIENVPLEVSVEIGKAKKLVRDIIDLTVGSIIELDKQAGDPVDIIVNGQMIAHGEVVVIDESFGVRVTEIINRNSKGR